MYEKWINFLLSSDFKVFAQELVHFTTFILDEAENKTANA